LSLECGGSIPLWILAPRSCRDPKRCRATALQTALRRARNLFRLCKPAACSDNDTMDIDEALHLLSRAPDSPIDVAELSLHLARDEYPELDVEAYLSEVNAIAHEASRLVRGEFDARVTGLCRYLFHDMGFRGNVKDYYDPRNTYFNQVLERRTGIPISLSAVTMAVG